MTDEKGRIPKLVIPRLAVRTATDDLNPTSQSRLQNTDHSRRPSTTKHKQSTSDAKFQEIISSISRKNYYGLENYLELYSRMNVVEKKRDIMNLLREHGESYLKLLAISRIAPWFKELYDSEDTFQKLFSVQQEMSKIADGLVVADNQVQLKK
jgi:hypothetical protein